MQDQLLDYIPQDDGYTVDAYLAPVPMLSNEIRLTYRPMHSLERATLVDAMKRVGEDKTTMILADALKSRIVSWSIKKREKLEDGSFAMVSMPIEKANLLILKANIWRRLCDIVIWGSDAGDLDPEKSAADNFDHAEKIAAAVAKGINIQDALAEDKAKN